MPPSDVPSSAVPDQPSTFVSITDGQLERAIYSNWDFQQALSATTFLLEECDFDRMYSYVELRKFRCYETSAIISFCRPFEDNRSSSKLSLRAIDVKLNQDEQAIKELLLKLRRKVVAHSDEELMHFRGITLQPFEDSQLRLPHFRYSETLHLEQADFRALEKLLHRLICGISTMLFRVAQQAPDRLERYKAPDGAEHENARSKVPAA